MKQPKVYELVDCAEIRVGDVVLNDGVEWVCTDCWNVEGWVGLVAAPARGLFRRWRAVQMLGPEGRHICRLVDEETL